MASPKCCEGPPGKDVSPSVIQTLADKNSKQQQQQHAKAGQLLNKQPQFVIYFQITMNSHAIPENRGSDFGV